MKTFVYAIVAVAATAAGFLVYRFGIEPRLVQEAPATEEPATSGPVSQTPTELPEFTLVDREGEPRSIRSWPGKSLIVNFWATWCAPCRREIPLLKQIHEEYAEQGFQVVGIAVDFREDVLKYADEMRITYPLLIGEQDGLDAINAFGLEADGFPFTIFTDQQSRIVLTHLGEITEEESKLLLDIINRVNRGELTPQAARAVASEQLAQLEQENPAA